MRECLWLCFAPNDDLSTEAVTSREGAVANTLFVTSVNGWINTLQWFQFLATSLLDRLASLVAEAWPLSFTALNIMSGFKTCGIPPINPSEISDRQIAPSKAVCCYAGAEKDSDDVPTSPLFTPEKEDLYKKRYEEGYNVDDSDYIAWLKIDYPTSVSSIYSGSSSSSAIDSTAFQSSKLSAGELDGILVLPHPTAGTKKKRKPALNSKAVCITEDEVLEELKKKENEKAQKRRRRKLRN